jgi:hypothetical protein
MKTLQLKLVAGCLALAPSGLAAQDSVILIGGPGSYGSNGTFNPAYLSDNVTKASARLVFHWDAMTSQLTLTVENTSLGKPGIPNPVLTDVFFNVPAGITGLSLMSQTGAGGATPTWVLDFDADLSANPNPNGANGFGAYNAMISTGGGAQNGIKNPLVGTIGIPPGTEVVGPVTFVFSATGSLAGISAYDFNSIQSVNPPGSQSFVGAAKFQAGGVAGSSGFISPAGSYCATAATAEDLGGGCGGAYLETELPFMGQTSMVTVSGMPPLACGTAFGSSAGAMPFFYNTCQVFLDTDPNSLFVIANFKAPASGPLMCRQQIPSYLVSPTCCGVSFVLQALFVDTSAPPGQRISVTNGWKVTIGS